MKTLTLSLFLLNMAGYLIIRYALGFDTATQCLPYV